MTAAVGFPTLRLIRVSVSEWHLNFEGRVLEPGEFRVLEVDAPKIKQHDSGKKVKSRSNNSRTYSQKSRKTRTKKPPRKK
jgi:hypothetical protein